MKIYIVEGTTGEYSDRSEWPVAAYADESLAQQHAEAAKRWYEEHDCFERHYDEIFQNPFDPFMHINYTGTDWTVYEVELRTELPESSS